MRPLNGLLCLIGFGLTFVGCPCVRSIVNNNPELRYKLFAEEGAKKICPDLQWKGIPLKISSYGPDTVGHFFTTGCQVTMNDADKTMRVDLSGTGYAALPLVRRVGFFAKMSVIYKPDFRMESDAIYVWGTYHAVAAPPELRIIGAENPLVQLANATPIGNLGTSISQSLMEGELVKGFTVIQADDGSEEFAIGHLDPPARVPKLFSTKKGRYVVSQDTAELRASTRIFIGPIKLPKDTKFSFRIKTEGAPISYGLYDLRSVPWRQAYEQGAPLTAPPPVPPMYTGMITQGGPVDIEIPFPAPLPVASDAYFLVLQNHAPPPTNALGLTVGFEAVAKASYVLEATR
ncbi:MAG: hypothetical protein KBF88_01670 [Polyangiaceae bacterium]|nr:hypothetical protein [Polyangiaceae bacterium]